MRNRVKIMKMRRRKVMRRRAKRMLSWMIDWKKWILKRKIELWQRLIIRHDKQELPKMLPKF